MNKSDTTKSNLNYTFPIFSRYFTLTLGIAVILYSLFIVFTQVHAESSTFKKVAPFIIILFAFDSVSRNLISLNKITITEKDLRFSYLAKKKVIINWDEMKKIEAHIGKKKYFTLHYSNLKTHQFPMAFNNIIEILNHIKTFAPHIETDEFVSSLIVNTNSREKPISIKGDDIGGSNE